MHAPSDDSNERLSPEEAQELLKAIEDVEREEAEQQSPANNQR